MLLDLLLPQGVLDCHLVNHKKIIVSCRGCHFGKLGAQQFGRIAHRSVLHVELDRDPPAALSVVSAETSQQGLAVADRQVRGPVVAHFHDTAAEIQRLTPGNWKNFPPERENQPRGRKADRDQTDYPERARLAPARHL